MYKSKDGKTIPLFPELFPIGGKSNENNRWLRIAERIVSIRRPYVHPIKRRKLEQSVEFGGKGAPSRVV